jgi:hypothetical protein
MIRYIGVLIFAGVMIAMIQPFDSLKPVDLDTFGNDTVVAEDNKSQVKSKPVHQQSAKKQRDGKVDAELMERLKAIKAHKLARQLFANTVIGTNFPVRL